MRIEYVLIGLGIAAVFIIGRTEIVSDIKRLMKRLDFTNEYLGRFDKVAVTLLHHKQNIDSATVDEYTWLLENVEKIQREVRNNGVLAGYRPAYTNYYFTNYHLFLNTLPALREGEADCPQVGFCIDGLIKHRGALGHYEESLNNDLRNPIIWLRRGVQFVVSFPLRVLVWSGLLSDTRFSSLHKGAAVKIISGLITLFGIVGTVFSIVSGWDITMVFLQRVFHLGQ